MPDPNDDSGDTEKLAPSLTERATIFSNAPKIAEVDSRVKEAWMPRSFNQRHVKTLKTVKDWDQSYLKANQAHNRIFQPGFASRDINEIYKDALLCGKDWLTDIICPSMDAALTIHIAKELLVYRKISEEELQNHVSSIYIALKKAEVLVVPQILETPEISEALKVSGAPPEVKDALRRIAEDELLKEQTYMLADELAKKAVAKFTSLKPKEASTRPNKDFVFLGSPCSGKSTISRNLISDEQKLNSVMLATDYYRGIFVPGTEQHEEKMTADVFLRTQDTAYMIKKLVEKELSILEKCQKRPNIIIDVATFERSFQKLLSKDTTVVVAAVDDIKIIPYRAYDRATDPSASPADKGRHINTSSLLSEHARASSELLTDLPENIREINIYVTNTTVTPGQNPPIIGKVCTVHGEEKLVIMDLKKMIQFLNKAKVNKKTTHGADLYMFRKCNANQFANTYGDKVQQMITMVKKVGDKPSCEIEILDDSGKPYIKLFEQNGEVKLEVLNKKILNKLLTTKSDIKKILQHLICYITFKEQAHEEIRIMGLDNAVKSAISSKGNGVILKGI